MQGQAEIFVFNEAYEKCRKHIYTDEKVFIMGSPSNRADDSDTLKFIGEDIFPIEQVRQKMSRSINIRFPFNAEGNGYIDQLISLAQTHKGSCSLIVHLMSSRDKLNVFVHEN